MSETFRKQYRGLEDTEIFSRETGLEMFDIVNREYEENGSFRCDFVATKERDRELVVCGFAGFYPCASRRTVS
jgi:hypothetical protein|uniref:Uncharacterized protein n=1 Tax=uncultured Rhodospirillales bacterium HF4000_38H21 TaxID=723612 RepID=E7C8H1_9PROT|nr:hypothetical protein [uncultured Rhodospirillales bacterium HF4000_38H21]